MNAQTETPQGSMFDTLKLLTAAFAVVGGIYAYYYFDTGVAATSLPQAVRVLMVLGGTIVGIAISMTSAQGQRLWHFIQGSRVEIRKVVWPTKQETTQTAIAVFVFTAVMMTFFWLLDMGLLKLVSYLVG
ncbi:MAG: preprotein translocase subunit SecE [Woeseiaceae bacterium]|nr:preprotein translocase subunit SecE [Woeseiaceae bacterium]